MLPRSLLPRRLTPFRIVSVTECAAAGARCIGVEIRVPSVRCGRWGVVRGPRPRARFEHWLLEPELARALGWNRQVGLSGRELRGPPRRRADPGRVMLFAVVATLSCHASPSRLFVRVIGGSAKTGIGSHENAEKEGLTHPLPSPIMGSNDNIARTIPKTPPASSLFSRAFSSPSGRDPITCTLSACKFIIVRRMPAPLYCGPHGAAAPVQRKEEPITSTAFPSPNGFPSGNRRHRLG